MFPQNMRIKKKDFPSLMAKGKSFHTPLFGARFSQSADQSIHCAVVVSKKTAKTAVARNRIKRRVRALLRQALPKQNISLILTVKKPLEGLSYEVIKADIASLLKAIQ